MPAYLFQQVINSNDVLQQEIFSKILASHKRTQEQLYRVSVLHSEHRVIHFLISYVARSGRQVGLEYVIKPILTHQGIGQIAGTSRQTVTTVLNKLRNDRIIHFNRTYLIIRDLDALKARLAERNRYV